MAEQMDRDGNPYEAGQADDISLSRYVELKRQPSEILASG